MAGAKRRPRASSSKKSNRRSAKALRRSRPTSAPTPPTLRTVQRSSAPTTAETSRAFGVSVRRLRAWAREGRVWAERDTRGRYYFPTEAELRFPSTARPAGPRVPPFRKKRPTKKALAPRAPRPSRAPAAPAAPATPPSSPPPPRRPTPPSEDEPRRKRRKKKAKRGRAKRPAKAAKKKRAGKKVPGRRPAKRPGKRPSKKKLRRRRKKVTGFVAPPLRPGDVVLPGYEAPFGVDVRPPARPPISAKHPMDVGAAAQVVGNAMRDYVMARLTVDREITHRHFYGLKVAFRQTYTWDVWYDTFDWIIDEWGLEPYVFDREALRDS